MKRLAFALLALLFASSEATAQSSPNFSYGQVPTAKQWNDAFSSKQDRLTFAPLNPAGGTMQGRLQTAPSTVNAAGLALLPGTAPNSPSNGDLWATTVGLYSRVGGRTLAIPGLDQATGALLIPNGPTLGTYQNGQFTSQPDAIQLQSGGLTCAAGATCDVTPGKVTATGASAGQTLGGWFSSLVFGTPTVTSLRAYSRLFIAPNSLITVGGYTSLGDGGGGSFYWSNTSTATDDGVLVITPTGNSGAGRWLRIFNGTLPIEAAGAACNGGTNDTAAFTRAFTAVAAGGRGGLVQIGPKACIVSGTMVVPSGVSFRGAGREATAILTNVATGDVFQFPNSNFGASDLTVASTVTRTSGAFFAVSGSRGTFRSIGFRGGYDGLTLDNYGNQAVLDVSDLLAEQMSGECISLGKFSTSPALFANGLHLSASTLAQCGTSMALYSASGVYVQDVESYQATGAAFAFKPTASHLGIQGVWFDQTLADSSTGDGWYFGGAGKIAEVKIISSQASSSGGHGLEIVPGTNLDSLLITDFQSTFNAQHGMRIGGGTNVTVRGGEFYYNGIGPGGVGIAVENNVSGFSIQGVQSGYGGWAKLNGLTMKQTYGAFVVGPNNNNYNISNNRWMGNTTGGLSDGGTGSNKLVTGNLTY